MNSPTTWIGLALVVVGVVWFGQGIGLIGGSAMSGEVTWAVIGPLVAIAGAAIAARNLRPRDRS